jgi:hypothetical protein
LTGQKFDLFEEGAVVKIPKLEMLVRKKQM